MNFLIDYIYAGSLIISEPAFVYLFFCRLAAVIIFILFQTPQRCYLTPFWVF
jgi:hypothetical protein